VRSGLQTFADDASATLTRVLAYLGALALAGILVVQLIELPESGDVAANQAAAQPGWTTVDRPHPAFVLSATSGEPEPRTMIRLHPLGGRKDIVSWGDAATLTPAGLVEIYRPGAELESFGDAPSEIAARTADLGEISRPTLLGTFDSKFGPLSLVEFATRTAEKPRNCLGFVRLFDDPRLQLAGWYCNGGPEIVDRGQLACALDRLALVAAGSDPKVAELFARAELNRTFCGRKSPILAATPRRTEDWLDAPADPTLRGRLAGR
jgi:hypothetical protein